MAFEDELSETTKTSKYNSGIAQIYRLDELWKACHLYKRKGDYNNWKITLDSIWSELSRDLTPDSEESKKAWNAYRKFIIECYSKKGNKNLLYDTMLREEIFLGQMQNELGKGTAYAEEDDFD